MLPPPETRPGALHDSKGARRLGPWLRSAETIALVLLLSMGWGAVGYFVGVNHDNARYVASEKRHVEEIARLQSAYSTRLGNTAEKVTEAANATAAAANTTAAAAQSVAETAVKQQASVPVPAPVRKP